MKDRCYNPNNKKYHIYGGKEIRVCKEWLDSFEVFEKWAMENGYKPELTIDRIDSNKNYCPENCRFVDYKTQNRNTSQNVWVEYNEEKRLLIELAEENNIPIKRVYQRIEDGYSIKDALDPNYKIRDLENTLVTCFNESKTLLEWSKDLRCKVPYLRLIRRYIKGNWDFEKALTTPLIQKYSH